MQKVIRNRFVFWGLFILGVLAILLSVNFYYKIQEKEIKEGTKEELSSIASLKIKEISDWFADEIADARIIAGDKELVLVIKDWLLQDKKWDQSELIGKMEQVREEHDYTSFTVVSKDLRRMVSSDPSFSHLDELTREDLIQLGKGGNIQSSDLYLCNEDNKIYIDFLAPIKGSESELLAMIVLRHSADQFLFPLIERWPVKSRTAETLFLRKENDHILFLNNLRHSEKSALKLKISLSQSNLPGVKAATGYKGFFEGIDYRGVRVLSYIDAIPGTPWFMVSKIDFDEIYDHFFFKAATPAIFSIVGVLLLFFFFYLYYIGKQRNFYRKLYTTEQEYKTTLYSIGDAVITTDKNGKVTAMNPIAERLTGWNEGEALRRPIEEIFVIIKEDLREKVENPVNRVLREGVVVGLANHTLLISREGKEMPIADSGAPIFDSNGEISGVILVFRDQTEERNQQQVLFESRRRMSTLLSNLPGMAYRCLNDPDWTMEFVSKGCEELTGYSSWEIEQNQLVSYGHLVYPEDRGYVWGKVEEALEKKEPFQIEYRIVTKQGDIEWVWEQGRGILNDLGEVIAIEGFITNITSRKNVELALKESEEIFNQFLVHSPIYIFFKDEKIRSVKLSRNFEIMLDRKMDELIGKNMYELFPSDFAKKMVEDDLEVLTRGEAISCEENFNGRHYLTLKFPLKLDGKQTYLAGFTIDITDQKIVEEALTASEKLFQTLAEDASVGIFRTNATGFTTYVNPAWCSLTGVSNDEALGKGWIEHVYPDDRAELINTWEETVHKKGKSKVEYRFQHPDGKVVWVKGEAVPELNHNDVLLGYVGTISDITELKISAETVQRTNNLLRTIIDNIPDAIYMKDIEGKKLIANKADILNCGFKTEEELLGKTDFDLFTEDVASMFWEDDKKVFKSGKPVIQREEHLINKDNKEKWLSTSKIPFRDKNGRIIGLVGIGHDITERKIHDENLLKLTKAITYSPVSIVITDLKGTIEYVNPKFTEITGYQQRDVFGKNPRILKSGNHTKAFYQNLWNTILSGNDWKGELQNKKKNGELYWENVIISPIFNESGEINYFVAVKEDITEKKNMMGELIKAKEKAEESDKLKSAFLANMSHEIRTPLNSILGFSNILSGEDELSKEEREEYTTIINKSAEGLLQIINDIIDISSLETGQLKTSIQPLKVNEILRSLNLVFSRKLVEMNKSHLILDLVLGEDITIMADENRFIQIMTNLANNAMKFTVRGTIRFGMERFDESKVMFFVSDTGIGISPEMHETVFERFRQAETDKNRTFGGNGLGLAIVKNLIELMGGQISMESEVGKGSIFRFWLPRAENSF